MDYGSGHYRRLMNEFGTVVDVFLSLDPEFQSVIASITKQMGDGMAVYIEKEVGRAKSHHQIDTQFGAFVQALVAARATV